MRAREAIRCFIKLVHLQPLLLMLRGLLTQCMCVCHPYALRWHHFHPTQVLAWYDFRMRESDA